MKKFYFFRAERELNAQRESRMVLHALPGQTTYVDWLHQNEPVDTTYKVQVTREQNHIVVRSSAGTIFGVCYEGRSLRELALRVYTRNDAKFYRTEAPLFVVEHPFSPSLINADAEMMDAYRQLVSASSGQASGTQQVQAQQPVAAAQNPAPSSSPAIQMVTIPSNEMELVESHIRSRSMIPEPAAVRKTLLISRLRDRMRVGVAKFEYIKQNGDRREAYGTCNPVLVGLFTGGTAASQRSTENDGAHVVYFDIKRRDWRCFCTEDFCDVQTDFLVREPSEVTALSSRLNNS